MRCPFSPGPRHGYHLSFNLASPYDWPGFRTVQWFRLTWQLGPSQSEHSRKPRQKPQGFWWLIFGNYMTLFYHFCLSKKQQTRPDSRGWRNRFPLSGEMACVYGGKVLMTGILRRSTTGDVKPREDKDLTQNRRSHNGSAKIRAKIVKDKIYHLRKVLFQILQPNTEN